MTVDEFLAEKLNGRGVKVFFARHSKISVYLPGNKYYHGHPFSESLDSCRLVENILSDDEKRNYQARIMQGETDRHKIAGKCLNAAPDLKSLALARALGWKEEN